MVVLVQYTLHAKLAARKSSVTHRIRRVSNLIGQGRILVIRYLAMRITGLLELEWGWVCENLHSWKKRTICRQRSAVEGLGACR
jgi:hypothetical protein